MFADEIRAEARRLFFNYFRAIKPAPRADDEPIFSSAKALDLKYNGEAVSGYAWGEQGPLVLCVHGAFGRGGQFAELIPRLLEAGFRVAVFDAPGYGNSPASFVSTDGICNVMQQIAAKVGPLHAIVAHSMGGKWALHAIQGGVKVDKMVCIANVANSRFMFERYLQMNRVSPEVAAEMEAMIDAVEGPDAWNRYSPLRAVEKLLIPGLVLHGDQDPVIPLSEGEALAAAWGGAKLVKLPGCNHFNILRAGAAYDAVIAFLG